MTQVLVDADPGTDDAVALATLLAGDADVAGITTVAGNTTVENTTRNALSILELLDRTDVPVAKGCGRPLAHSLSTAEWVHGPGGLRGELPAPSGGTVDEHAVEFILERARELGTDLTLVALGPLTNVAAALAREPELPSMVDDVIVMGGSAWAGGNATPAAEFNFYVDPVAASRVVQDAMPKMVGLDVTERSTLPPDIVGEFRRSAEPLSAIGEWCRYPEELRADDDEGFAVHDAAVTAHLLSDVLSFEAYPVSVVIERGPSRGATIADKRVNSDAPPDAQVAVDVDVEAFRTTVVDALTAFE